MEKMTLENQPVLEPTKLRHIHGEDLTTFKQQMEAYHPQGPMISPFKTFGVERRTGCI